MSDKHRKESIVKIACCQMEPIVGNKSDNLKKSIQMIEEAASNGANLIVLPELCNSGYVFETREEAFKLSEEIPSGDSCKSWSKICKKLGVHIVAGINERAGDLLYNSSVVLGPNDYVGTFRKVHLWNEENLFFEPGDLGFPVFKTPIGRISCHICYDSWFPESYRLAALQGADIVCVSTNWVPIPGQDKDREAMVNYGTKLSMAFQVKDDLFDILGHEKQTGKDIGADVKKNLITLPLIHAYDKASKIEIRRLNKILGSKKKTRIDLDHIKEIIDRIGGFNYAKDKITDFNEQALDAISPYPNSPYKQSMIDLIAFNMQRTG